MRYLLTLFILVFSSTSFADHKSSIYLLTSNDADSLVSGFNYALTRSPDNQAVDWTNPATGLSGATVPLRTFQTAYGQLCREYMSTVQLDGSLQQAFGTACRQPSGNWKIAAEKLVQRDRQALKFVYLKQPRQQVSQPCPFTLNQPPVQRTYKQQQLQQQFHSDRFHEKFRTFERRSQPTPENHDVEPETPSKLLKLVAY